MIASGVGGRYPSELWGGGNRVVLPSPPLCQYLCLLQFSRSSLSFLLKLSLYPFSHGLPGWMKSVFTPTRPSQPWTTLAVNSGPLSERICSGARLTTNNSVSAWITSSDPSRYFDRHALPRIFIDHCEHSDRTSVLCPAGHEVVSPHMTFSLWFQPDD